MDSEAKNFEIVDQAMKLAIQEAYKGAPYVSPNPIVGCAVISKDGRIISSGYHKKFGGPHAEVEALLNLSSSDLQAATVVVTLEPCAHEGKTPSCAKMLATKPIRQVIYGLMDPNPLVSGQGAQILNSAGISCQLYSDFRNLKIENTKSETIGYSPLVFTESSFFSDLSSWIQNELPQVCEVFLKNYKEKKVFVAAKIATSLDGFVAETNGSSRWVTGPDSRQHVHWLRASYDAIAVGANTFIKDNPQLNIRHSNINKQNNVIIFDPNLETIMHLKKSEVFKIHSLDKVFVVCQTKFQQSLVQQLEEASFTKDEQILLQKQFVFSDTLAESYRQLYDRGIRSVFVESGGGLLQGHFQEKCLDRLYFFQSNQLLGQGLHWQRGANESLGLSQAPRLKNIKIRTFLQDILITGTL